MPRMRRQVLRPRPQAADLLALRREGRGAARKPAAGPAKPSPTPRRRPPRAPVSPAAVAPARSRPGHEPRVDARAGRGDRPRRRLAESAANRRFSGSSATPASARRRSPATSPRRRRARPRSPPSPARRRSSCVATAAPARPPSTLSSTAPPKAPTASPPSPSMRTGRRRGRASSSLTNARWSTPNSRATSCRLASRSWCSATRSSSRPSRAAATSPKPRPTSC